MNNYYIYIFFIIFLISITSIIIVKYKNKLKICTEQKEALENQYYMQLKHYEAYTNNYDKYRKFKHDLKNHLIILDILMNKNEYEKAKNYLKDIEKEFEDVKIISYSNNIMIDSVLYNINEICKIKEIDLKVKINNNNYQNKKIFDFTEFLIYSLYDFIEIVEKERNKREILCNIKLNENNILFQLETSSINKYNKLFVDDIKNKLKKKAKNKDLTVEFTYDNKFSMKCLLS